MKAAVQPPTPGGPGYRIFPPPGGVLSAYQADTGTTLWTSTVGDQLFWAPVALTGERILAGTAGATSTSPPGKVFAFDLAGKLVWTFSPGSDVLG